jgi:hypothetical protein
MAFAYVDYVTFGIKRGKLDEDGLGDSQSLLLFGAQHLALAELTVLLQQRSRLCNSDVLARASVVNDE